MFRRSAPARPSGDGPATAPPSAFPPAAPPATVKSVLCRAVTLCWSLLQLSNMIATALLVFAVFYLLDEMRTMQTEITQQHARVEELRTQVQTKQEGQIQELHQAVEQEHTLTVTTLAGTFTLVTCLVTMFHMSSHLNNYNEPRVQRKIVAILWMSPIYSVTSLLSLTVPAIEVYLAIVKDCYESYCIYTFLAFLIAVLGRSRNKPTNGMEDSQYHHRNSIEYAGDIGDKDIHNKTTRGPVHLTTYRQDRQNYDDGDDTTIVTAATTAEDSVQTPLRVSPMDEREAVVRVLAQHADHLNTPTRCLRTFYHPPPETSDYAKANAVLTECQIMALQFVFVRPLTSVANCVLTLLHRHVHAHDNDDHVLSQTDGSHNEAGESLFDYVTMMPSMAPSTNPVADDTAGGSLGDSGTRRWLNEFINDTVLSSPPSPFPLTGEDSAFDPTVSSSYDEDVGNSTTNGAISILSDTDGLQQATISYFTSPGFVVAMITNISVFFAFTGLLKFYHAVRDDLAWCQPFPKFLTIKGVVFLTFWQGLAIRIALSLEGAGDPEEAIRIQNILVCLEMLFFSITHWCVFPAEEWKPGYEDVQRRRAKPGFGLQDFVQDVSQIYRGRRRIRRRGKVSYTIQPGIDTMGDGISRNDTIEEEEVPSDDEMMSDYGRDGDDMIRQSLGVPRRYRDDPLDTSQRQRQQEIELPKID